MKCRHCATQLSVPFLDLGTSPPSNAYLTARQLEQPETHFPLRLFVCEGCWLVQTQDFSRAEELFSSDYAYFSSVSVAWVEHAARYVEMITNRLALTASSQVVEVASNDGYLLRHFVARGIPCLGIEPTDSTATAAEQLGIPVRREFFGATLGRELQRETPADLIIGNNVYAHVPDINDFTRGLEAALTEGGTITLEFPHLLRLIEGLQFDTVYHEHYSYLSLFTVSRVFADAGLRAFDVEELPTHGGSLRVYGCREKDPRPTEPSVSRVIADEESGGLRRAQTYVSFQDRVVDAKNAFLSFLLEAKARRKSVVGYGAAAKGNTLLNFAGVRADLLPFVCDAAPSKQGKFLPGSRIPIRAPEALLQARPDYVLVLPWNIVDEVCSRLSAARGWGAQFVTAIPTVTVR